MSVIVFSVQKKIVVVVGDVDLVDLLDLEQKKFVKGKKCKIVKDEDELDILEVEKFVKKGKGMKSELK